MDNSSNCANVLSIDVEDWYHSSLDLFKDTDIAHGSKPEPSVVSNTLKCLELLARNKSRATFFVLATVCEHYPDLAKEILHQGHEVATHGYAHRLIYKTTPEEFEADLKKSLDILTRIAPDIKGHRAPYWSITKDSLWAIDILIKCGLEYDSSIFPIRRGLYGIPNAPTEPYEIRPNFWEFPPATLSVFGQNLPIAGGGYFRIVPYPLIQHAIRRAHKNSQTLNRLVFYLHPYELDPSDTKLKHKMRLASSFFYFWQQKFGRQGNPDKILRFLDSYRFISFADLINNRQVEETHSPSRIL